MTVVWFDPQRAASAGSTWVEFANQCHGLADQVEHQLIELGLGEWTETSRCLATAASQLWNAAAVVRRAADAVTNGDAAIDLGSVSGVAALALAVGAPHSSRVGSQWSSVRGDPGGLGNLAIRRPYGYGDPYGAASTAGSGSSPAMTSGERLSAVERGRQIVMRALADTHDTEQIRADEFGLVELDTGKWVVVLPGVVDLSKPDIGWHNWHQSIRDIQMAAWASAGSTDTGTNYYAQYVEARLKGAGVPPGAELLIVGHSFGADTALDLAADESFNGPNGYRVSHVVAAGYSSRPQLSEVGPETSVLVLQNRYDAAVIGESIGDAGVLDAIRHTGATVSALLEGDAAGAVEHRLRAGVAEAGVAAAAVSWLVRSAPSLAKVAGGAVTNDPRMVVDGTRDVLTLEPGVDTPTDEQVVAVFEGGLEGVGHDPKHYVNYIADVDDEEVVDFLTQLAEAGFSGPGVATAIDVSVPMSR